MTFAMPNALLAAWHPEYPGALVATAMLLLITLRSLTEGPALLRNTLVFLGIFLVLLVASGVAGSTGMGTTSAIADGAAVILLGILVIRLSGMTVFRVVLPRLGLRPPRILEDILLVFAYLAWGLVRLHFAGLNFSGLVTTSAVITGVIAISMQETLGNILGGMALQLEDSLNIGDWIHVDDISGRVIEIHWRHTSVRTRNGEIVVFPNSTLTRGKFTIVGSQEVRQTRRWVHFFVAFQVVPHRVIEPVEKALHDADIPNVAAEPRPQCIIMDLKDGATHYAVRYWLTDPQVDDPTDSAVRAHVFAALQREGISLAHPNMDVFLTSEDSRHASEERSREQSVREKMLRRVELFAHLGDVEIAHLARTLTYVVFAMGDVITRQGATAHWLYVLIKGEVDVWYESSGNGRRLLATLGAGQVFGEMGMMTGEPRRATVTAHSDAECYRIDKASFDGIMQSRPELAEQFATILAERTRGLAAAEQEQLPVDHENQRAHILASIRRFFGLDSRR